MGQRENTPITILIVDNDEKILSILQEYLELSHYQVRTAASGLEALKLLRTEPYDVLLTDIVMPDISGLGLIEIARKEFPALPIVAMTGYGRQVRNLASEHAPDCYLEKPFNLEELSKAVESLLHRG